MVQKKVLKIALLGNPNSGKSSLFNQLTGLNQKIGNFPGVTVDKKVGLSKINAQYVAEIIDLPGTYSLYPKSLDEQIVFDFLNSPDDEHYPDFMVVVVDATNLKRNLLLFTQVRDLGFPVILAINMLDLAKESGISIDIDTLRNELNVPIVPINARTGEGVHLLKAAIACPVYNAPDRYLDMSAFHPQVIQEIQKKLGVKNDYLALQIAHQYNNLQTLDDKQKQNIQALLEKNNFDSVLLQSKETVLRYDVIHKIYQKIVRQKSAAERELFSQRIDRIVTHKFWGYFIFFALLFILFQAVFSWATGPMDLIDSSIATFNGWVKSVLPAGPVSDLITDGLIAGLGGVLIFIPQIALLFAFISILEESGYMTRVMFLMDKMMRKFGLNGRSVIPLISGVACAVPAIMATRNIENWKERMVTIFITPLMSCSARIPVFTVLIALVVPEQKVLGFLNMQGLVLMALYIIGFVAAILSAWVLSKILKSKEKTFFIMEFPSYKVPRWKNVGITIAEKVKAFTVEAGKVIIAISVVLWVLASYGPGNDMAIAEQEAIKTTQAQQWSSEQSEQFIASKKLENSYAGHFGKWIEPGISPLGFDWKIGIALITSFAAREVFVGTMATIYSVGSDDEENKTVIERMRQELNPETGKPFYSVAVASSLLIFYLFAMQCMSTLAVVYRETKSIKWPLIQFAYMTILAWGSSFIIYQLLR